MSDAKAVRSKSIGHYVLMKTIGEGTFGKVKLGTHILTGERVAVKVLEKERFAEIADIERVAREIHILKLIRHPHVIRLYEIIETPKQLYLIMEYACGGELFDYIVQQGRAEEREACRFLHQIMAGIEKVHSMRVVHRDLKPENLLLDDRKDIKIVDFGLSNTYQEGQLLQTACGSPCYAAPEMIAGKMYVPSMVDIWSCGVILFALVCGYLPFESSEDQNHAELYRKILSAEYEMPNFVSADVASLISGMLTTEPEQRLTLDGVRSHTWYSQIPEASIPDFEDAGVLDEDILEQLSSYGFPHDYTAKCLQTNKHNHATTTYYLLKEKRHMAKKYDKKTATDKAIAELDAAGTDDVPFEATAVAAVATPSRGQRTPSGSRRRDRRPSSAARGHAQPAHDDGSGMAWHGHVYPTGLDNDGGTTPRAASCVSTAMDPQAAGSAQVPRLSFGTLAHGAEPCPGTAGFDAVAMASERSSHVRGAARSSSPPGVPRGYRHSDRRSVASGTPRQRRPMSARPCSSAAAAPLSGSGGYGSHASQSSHRPYSPFARANEYATESGYCEAQFSLGWHHPGETAAAPLSARPRLQGNSAQRYRERPRSARPAGGPSPAWGQAGVAGAPLSARGSRGTQGGGTGSCGEDLRQGQAGALHINCKSSLPPRQIVQELLGGLAAHRVAFRQVSGWLVHCQVHGVCFEAEVLQLSRGAGFVLRFSHVSGDVWQYRDICSRILADISL